MGRLIDADALIEEAKELHVDDFMLVLGMVNKQPTAYDVEKVLLQLKEAETDVSSHGHYAIYADDAIKIALKGGVE